MLIFAYVLNEFLIYWYFNWLFVYLSPRLSEGLIEQTEQKNKIKWNKKKQKKSKNKTKKILQSRYLNHSDRFLKQNLFCKLRT